MLVVFTITGHQGLSFPHGEGLWGQINVSVLPAQLQAEERGERGFGGSAGARPAQNVPATATLGCRPQSEGSDVMIQGIS